MRNLKTALWILAVCAAGFLFFRRGLPEQKPAQAAEANPAGCPETVVPPAPAVLIQGGEETDIPWTSRTPAAKRVRKIFPDPAWMTPDPVLKVGDRIELALFEDAVFDADISNVTRYPNGSVGMTAHLQDATRGVVYLSYADGVLAVSVEVTGRGRFEVLSRDGVYYAIEVDRAHSDILEDGAALVPDGSAEEPVVFADPVSDPQTGTVSIDVMVVYSPAAASWASTNGGIDNVIAGAMQRANEAHNNSDTRVTLNLVHSEQVSYTESGSSSTDLSRLRKTADGYLDAVHTLRETYNADLVCLMLVLSDAGGLGYLLTDEAGERDYGFCVTRVQQSRSTYTVVHEWGHNMGCSHSKTQTLEPWSGELFSFSAGWQWNDTAAQSVWPYTQQGYCSIMTYEDFDDDDIQEYERVARFSNPSISYTGAAVNVTGDVADGDNARTIRASRYAVADYQLTHAPIASFPYSNSFEYGFVDWIYDGGTALWEREDGTDNNLKTAVAGGYSGTTNAADGRFFAYVDAAFNENSNAFLAATFDFSGLLTAEMDFSYYMYSSYSPRMGSLSLQVSTNAGVSWISLWTKSGNQGTGWKQAAVSLNAYAGRSNVMLRFRADLGSNWIYTYIELDSVYVNGTPNSDLDNDGLPNEWELLYFGGETNANPAVTASNGVNTVLQTYIAGISPVDPAAFFKVNTFETPVVSGNGFVIGWNATSGRVYSVHWATNLVSSFQPLETNIVWPQASYTDTVYDAETRSFYKVNVQLAE